MSDAVAAAPGHELLLALAGWVDDDLLAIGRELVAVGEEVGALELVVASLAAARTALPHPVRRRLADAVERRLGADLVPLVPPGAALPDRTTHVFAPDPGDPDGTTRIGEVVAGLTAVGRSGARTSVTWRLTPAGAAPGPLPHPVVLLALDDPAVAEVLSYQVGAALARAGIPASVEAFEDGSPLPPYHRAALAAARPFPRSAPSPADGLAAATPTVATVTGPHGHDVRPPDLFSAPPGVTGAPELGERGIGDTAPRLAAVGGSVPPASSSVPVTPPVPVTPSAPVPMVDGGPGADRPVADDAPGGAASPAGAHDDTYADSRTDDPPTEVPPPDGSRAEVHRDDERRADAHRADAPDAGELLTDGSDPDDARGYRARGGYESSRRPGTRGDGRATAADRTVPGPAGTPPDTVRRPDGTPADLAGDIAADDTAAGDTAAGDTAAGDANAGRDHRPAVSDPGAAPQSVPGTTDRAPDGTTDVDPGRFDPARNAVDRTVHGGNGVPVAGRAPTTTDDPDPAAPDAVAARTGPPRPGPSADQERPAASNGHPSPRPAPRRLPRPTPAADPSGPERPSAVGHAAVGATEPTAALPADEREWDRQWSNGSWSMPADPDIEPATSPTPTTPPLSPSPTRRTPGDAAPADAPARPRHRLDVPEVFATPDPDGLPSEDVLDSRLTPNEQELLRRLQQELAARERGSAETPRNGAVPPDAD